MALPTPQRTWIIDPCNRISFVSVLDTMQRYLYGVKEFLKANGYTVKGSSNGTTGAMDGVDRWLAPTNVVRGTAAATPQSWVVLTDTAAVDLLIAFQGGGDYFGRLSYSPSSLFIAAGTPTHQPTATDEVVFHAVADLIGSIGSGDRLWSGWVDAAGNGCRFAIARSDIWIGRQWGVEQVDSLVEAPAVLPKTIWGFAMDPSAVGGNISTGTRVGLARVAIGGGAGANISINFGMEIFPVGSSQNAWASVWSTIQPELQGGSGYPIWPLTLQSSTAGARGKLANAIDHWTSRSNGADGDTYGALQFVAMGGYLEANAGSGIWPWDGVSGVVMI